MALKPSEKLDWVTDDSPLKIIEPSDAKKLLGWTVNERPPFQFFNWQANLIDKWLQYINAVSDVDFTVGDGDDDQYTTLAAALAAATANTRILVSKNLVLTAPAVVDEDGVEIIFRPGVTIQSDSINGTGIQVQSENVKIRGGLFSNFAVAAIEADTGSDNLVVADAVFDVAGSAILNSGTGRYVAYGCFPTNVNTGGSGGGSGGGLILYPAPSGGPSEDIDPTTLFPRWNFSIEQVSLSPIVYADKALVMTFRVSDDYVPGSQIFLNGLRFVLDALAEDNLLMRASTAFYSGTSGLLSGEHISTNTEKLIVSDPNPQIVAVDGIDLSDVDGEIDSIAVAPGDLLRIILYRDFANESTPTGANCYLVKDTLGVSL